MAGLLNEKDEIEKLKEEYKQLVQQHSKLMTIQIVPATADPVPEECEA